MIKRFCTHYFTVALLPLFFLPFLSSKATAIFNVTCESSFSTTSGAPNITSYESKVTDQARQFVQLLITTQSEALSPSQRQSRLADAQRVFTEITKAHPEIADQILREWRDRFGGSPSALLERRAKLSSDIHILEQALQRLINQSVDLREWGVLRDSSDHPAVKQELRTLLFEGMHRENGDVSLQVRDMRFIEVKTINNSNDFDAKSDGGHTLAVLGAKLLPNGRVISWGSDNVFIVWKLTKGKLSVNYKFGESANIDPKKGHTGSVYGAQVLPDGRILSWSNDNTLIIWHQRQGIFSIQHRLGIANSNNPDHGHVDGVLGGQPMADGRILSWSTDGTLILWKHENGRFVIHQRLGKEWDKDPEFGHTSIVAGAHLLADGRILSWSGDRTIIIWRLEDGEFVIDYKIGDRDNVDPKNGHTREVLKALALPDGSIVSLDGGDRLLLWGLVFPSAVQLKIDQLSQELEAKRVSLSKHDGDNSLSLNNGLGGIQ